MNEVQVLYHKEGRAGEDQEIHKHWRILLFKSKYITDGLLLL